MFNGSYVHILASALFKCLYLPKDSRSIYFAIIINPLHPFTSLPLPPLIITTEMISTEEYVRIPELIDRIFSFLGHKEEETGVPETGEQRKHRICQVYEQFGALTLLKELGIRYDIQKGSPVHFYMMFKTGLKAMGPYVSSLEFLVISDMECRQIGKKEWEWMEEHNLSFFITWSAICKNKSNGGGQRVEKKENLTNSLNTQQP